MRAPRILAAALAALAACSREPAGPPAVAAAARAADADPVEVVVYAATSTRDALLALAEPYEAAHAVDLVFNFGASGDLAKQIVAAAKADAFLSADEAEMDRVDASGLLAAGTRRALLSNRLVVVEPAADASPFTAPFDAAQLAGERVTRLSLGDAATVPAGRYARAWLERSGVWPRVSGRVLPGVDARAALAAVESGAAQAGIVYATDTARSTRARVVFAVPVEDGPRIAYPVAAIAGRPAEREARAWIDFLASDAARAAFETAGFAHLGAAGR